MNGEDEMSGRKLKLGSMGFGIAGSYLGYLLQSRFLSPEKREEKLKAAHAQAGKRAREELQTLRGPVMKLGQALSLQGHALPDEVIAELSQLQMKAPGMHPSLVRVQFKNSLGRYPEEVFARFEPTPFAAASLGQVHRAMTQEGQDVAVKIQYPGIRDAIASDFKTMRLVLKPAQVSGHIGSEMLGEIERQITAETDYIKEAQNIDFFRRHAAALDYLEVPAVFKQYSTDKVLTMSFMPGRHIDEFLLRRPSQALKDKIGARLLDSFYFQLLKMKAVHADPHWGNILLRDDGTIGLVDFGCVKYVRPEFVAALERVYRLSDRKDSKPYEEALKELYHISGAAMSSKVKKAMLDFSKRFYEKVYPHRNGKPDGIVDFGETGLMAEFSEKTQTLFRDKGLLWEYAFIFRAESGLYSTLHRLGARVRTSAIVEKYLG